MNSGLRDPETRPRRVNILCVDDESSILSSLRRALRRVPGYQIHIAPSGAAGLAVLDEHEIDLVLSDMRMPEMDGAEFLSRVATQWPDTVRIALTGYADLRSTVDAVNEAGIFRYLHKPWDDGELKHAIARGVERRHLELDRRRALEEAWTANQARDEFLANMSHELKTPLHAVLSCCRLSERALESGDQEMLTESIRRIRTNGETLLSLVGELLDLSKLDVNAQALSVTNFDVVVVVRSCIEALSGLVSEKSIMLQLDAPAELDVELDREQFSKALRNIVGNAIRYVDVGGEVTISLGSAAEQFVCTVRDNGPGVPEAEIEKIFDKFVQSSITNAGAGGTGLGLAITRGIVTAHGGTIAATNRPEGGLEVTIALPQRGGTVD